MLLHTHAYIHEYTDREKETKGKGGRRERERGAAGEAVSRVLQSFLKSIGRIPGKMVD